LIGVVYKLVTPTTTAPLTEISPPKVVNTTSQTSSTQTTQSTQTTTTPTQPPAPPAPAPTVQPSPVSQTTNAQPVQQMPNDLTQQPPVTAPVTNMAQPPTTGQAIPMPGTTSDVIPVVSASPVTVVNGPAPDTQIMDSTGAVMTADTRRVEAEIQAEYSRKIEGYQTENKLLQQQMQTLSSQVGLLESKMNQLVTSLNQQYQTNASPQNTNQMAVMPAAATIPAPAGTSVEQVGPPPRIPYNVTAIIPGRAWLRSNNGDTLTVAEGDQIKGVGRVAKIDPYDGVIVVEMPGGKSVSLSYGNGS